MGQILCSFEQSILATAAGPPACAELSALRQIKLLSGTLKAHLPRLPRALYKACAAQDLLHIGVEEVDERFKYIS